MSEDAEDNDDRRRKRGLPPQPRPPGEKREPANPPKPVRVAVALWALAGVLLIAGYVETLLAKDEIAQRFIEQSPSGEDVTPQMIRDGTTTLLWVLLVGAVVFAILYWLFAYKAWEGTRSARTILALLVAITLVFQIVLLLPRIALASSVCAIVALILMHLPSVSDYFPKVPKSLS